MTTSDSKIIPCPHCGTTVLPRADGLGLVCPRHCAQLIDPFGKSDDREPRCEKHSYLGLIYSKGNKMVYCDCERSANGLGMAGIECDCGKANSPLEVALDHLALVLSLLASLSPMDRCRGLDDAQTYYNSMRPHAKIAPIPGYITKLVDISLLDWAGRGQIL